MFFKLVKKEISLEPHGAYDENHMRIVNTMTTVINT